MRSSVVAGSILLFFCPFSLFLSRFHHKDLQHQKTLKQTKMLDNNTANGLTNINKGVRLSTKQHSSFSMENAKPVTTPLMNHFRLSTSQCPKTVEETEDMSKVPYASAVGCVMYAMVSKYMENPGKQHWELLIWTP
jgi:hypothetical protein